MLFPLFPAKTHRNSEFAAVSLAVHPAAARCAYVQVCVRPSVRAAERASGHAFSRACPPMHAPACGPCTRWRCTRGPLRALWALSSAERARATPATFSDTPRSGPSGSLHGHAQAHNFDLPEKESSACGIRRARVVRRLEARPRAETGYRLQHCRFKRV